MFVWARPCRNAHIALLGGIVGTIGFEDPVRRLLNFILERNDFVAVRSPIAGSGTLWFTKTVFWSWSPRISAAADVIGSLRMVLEKSIEWCLDRGRGLPRLSGGGVGVNLFPDSSGLVFTFICISLALCILDMRYASWSLLLSKSDRREWIKTSFFCKLSVKSAFVDFNWNCKSFILESRSPPKLSSRLFSEWSSLTAELYSALSLLISAGE